MLISSVWRAGSGWVFSTGLVLGGAVAALLAAVVGALILQSWVPLWAAAGVVLILLLVAFARDLGVIGFPLPQNARQVPEAISRSGPLLGALQFGFEMGTGMRTFMTSALPHVVLIAVALLADPWQALAAGIGFGLGRSAVPLGRGVAGDGWTDLFDRHQHRIRVLLNLVVVLSLVVIVTGSAG